MSIETVETYTGYGRPEGQIKLTVGYVFHCTKCDTYKPTKNEIDKHDCKKAFLRKIQGHSNENSSMQ